MLISMLTCVGSSSSDRADARSASSAAVKSSSAPAPAAPPPRADLMALEMATSGMASSASSASSSISICRISPRGSDSRDGSGPADAPPSGVPNPCRSRACSRNRPKSLTGSAVEYGFRGRGD